MGKCEHCGNIITDKNYLRIKDNGDANIIYCKNVMMKVKDMMKYYIKYKGMEKVVFITEYIMDIMFIMITKYNFVFVY